MLIILLFCLVVVTGLLSLGVMVWFVVLGMEEGWGTPSVFNICGLGSKINTQPPISSLYEESLYAQFK